jgi:hypothetical protein
MHPFGQADIGSARKRQVCLEIRCGEANQGHCWGLQGNALMKFLESGIRVFTLAQGTGVRWLREELSELSVKTPLTDGCLEEMLRDADVAAWQAVAAAQGSSSYLTELRQQIREQAMFVQRWTGTDEKITDGDVRAQAFVRIARKYALPRPWKLSDPVAVESHRLRPSNWKWATAIEALQARSVA